MKLIVAQLKPFVLIFTLLLLIVQFQPAAAQATNITLGFNSLPSAQGWVYADLSGGLPETAGFQLVNGMLHQSTFDYAYNSSAHYELHNVVQPGQPFTLTARVRITRYEGVSGNPGGFNVRVHLGTEEFELDISPGKISGAGADYFVTFDVSQFHTYRMEGVAGAGFQIFVDDNFLGAASTYNYPGYEGNWIGFGDGTEGAKADVDIASLSFVQAASVLNVGIDIKPGDYPNPINLGSNGKVPVAILSSDSFDATTVNPTSITLAGASVAVKGNGTSMASVQDVNGDGRADLVVQVNTEALQLSSSDTQSVLEGQTYSGTHIRGYDTIVVVP